MNKIIDVLKKQKSIPLDRYINIALYDKKFGYYSKNNPFGKKGDFITSPLISNLFSEMIAIWCIAFWENLKKPKRIVIVELGPGDGSLCENILKIFKKFRNFYECLEINLLETSSKLQKIQKSKIINKKVKWIKEIKTIDFGPVIFIGNEFFDSLPIKQLYKKNNLLFEKHVCLSSKKQKIKFLYKEAHKNLVKSIKSFNSFSSNNIIEYPGEAIKYLLIIAKKIKKFNGGLLTFDYGYTQKKGHDTLQSIKNHKYTDPFLNPGNSDITSHVNFLLFEEILKKNNLQVEKIISQSEFLQKLGIVERANILSKEMTFKEKANLYYRLKKLLSPKEMGNLFKVLFVHTKKIKFSLGF